MAARMNDPSPAPQRAATEGPQLPSDKAAAARALEAAADADREKLSMTAVEHAATRRLDLARAWLEVGSSVAHFPLRTSRMSRTGRRGAPSGSSFLSRNRRARGSAHRRMPGASDE